MQWTISTPISSYTEISRHPTCCMLPFCCSIDRYTNRGQLKLADFGMARTVGYPARKLSSSVFFSGWLSLLGRDIVVQSSRAADWSGWLFLSCWHLVCADSLASSSRSVGCIFGELLKREPLFQGKDEKDQLLQYFSLLGMALIFLSSPQVILLKSSVPFSMLPTCISLPTSTSEFALRTRSRKSFLRSLLLYADIWSWPFLGNWFDDKIARFQSKDKNYCMRVNEEEWFSRQKRRWNIHGSRRCPSHRTQLFFQRIHQGNWSHSLQRSHLDSLDQLLYVVDSWGLQMCRKSEYRMNFVYMYYLIE